MIPYKVDFKAEYGNEIYIMNFLPSVCSLELAETGIRELIGRVFYLIKS